MKNKINNKLNKNNRKEKQTVYLPNTSFFFFFPHPDPPSHLPLHPLPLGFPSAPGPSASLMHPTWAGDLFHSR